ncbi:dihydrolipoyl dehydrogenase [Allopusillimonas soli]|uniref:Dihydrolipoyl dehydrogenase n=1 Tax=Allopusillimonas soli TaxID=659016 RepID=A0A853F996_9BURK|nr:dihydrolipoyl dehydrogenase [Allopusillimonas soli]NYT36663.1 dihydrolipoyl dehydrogenase [Allopusillimonas soli]TEA75145.1 dihydrolipoyl dehydrogenase [Allopusillimonas soli]
MKQLETDVAIIGAGTAGLSAYRAVKRAGIRALLIEGGPYGTTCARVGCMPSKLLIAAADAAHAASQAGGFGVHIDGRLRVDGVQVMARVRSERDRFVGFVLDSVHGMPEDDKLSGHACFVSDNVLQVDGHTEVHAGRIVIATGSAPNIPDPFKGLGERVIVNDDVFAWTDLPARVLVVGTGIIGLELGQALARLGVRVTLLNRSEGVGGLRDPAVLANARAAFAGELDLQLGAQVTGARLADEAIEVQYRDSQGEEKTERYDYVLAATGRRPNVAGLGLEKTTARLDERGMPAYDAATLQLCGLPVFIAGDVNGASPLLHEAADDGHIAGNNAAAYPDIVKARRRAPLSIVFTDPQLARVGKRYDALAPQAVVCGEVDFANQGRARIIRKNQGLLRVYADRGSGRFLGAEMAGPAMEHVAHLLAWSLQQELTVQQMLDMPFYHPVIEEGVRTALRMAAKKQMEAELDYVRECEQAVNSE